MWQVISLYPKAIPLTLAAFAIAGASFWSAGVPSEIAGLARVVDGDTLEIDGYRIRLWGIDAPEWDTHQGQEATRSMRAITDLEWIVCEPTGDRSYERIVARCYVDGHDIAAIMVIWKQARDVPKFSRGCYAPGGPCLQGAQ